MAAQAPDPAQAPASSSTTGYSAAQAPEPAQVPKTTMPIAPSKAGAFAHRVSGPNIQFDPARAIDSSRRIGAERGQSCTGPKRQGPGAVPHRGRTTEGDERRKWRIREFRAMQMSGEDGRAFSGHEDRWVHDYNYQLQCKAAGVGAEMPLDEEARGPRPPQAPNPDSNAGRKRAKYGKGQS